MDTIRRIIATALTAISVALAYLATAGTAGAMPAPPPERGSDSNQLQPEQTSTVVTHTGSAIWTYIVVAIAAAVVTLAIAWMIAKVRHSDARRRALQANAA